jgi:hypothetical protein
MLYDDCAAAAPVRASTAVRTTAAADPRRMQGSFRWDSRELERGIEITEVGDYTTEGPGNGGEEPPEVHS